MASKKNYAQGEMRPLSALSKGKSSDTKKKTSPSRVPEPPKYPQYNFINVQADPKDILDPLRDMEKAERKNIVQPDSSHDTQIHKPMEEVVLNIPLSQPVYNEPAVSREQSEPEIHQEPETVKPAVSVKPPRVVFTASETEQEKPEITHKSQQEAEKPVVHKVKPRPVRQTEYETVGTVIRKRGEKAPDLTDKAARDAFFSKYASHSVQKTPERSPELEEALQPKEPVGQARRINPFFNRFGGRPVISHLKEDPETEELLKEESAQEVPAEDNTADKAAAEQIANETFTEEAPPEMRENIEEAMRIQREERENAQRDPKAEEMEKAKRTSHRIRSIGIMGIIVVCGVFLLFGERSTFSAEENRKLAEKPEFSLQSYLSGDFTSGLSSYYNDTVPMRSTFKRAISSMENLKGIKGNDEENVEFFGNVSVQEQANVSDETPTDAPAVTTAADMSAVSESLFSTDATGTTTATTTTEPEEYEPPVEVGDSIIIYNKRAISFYGGLPSITEEYANVLIDFKLALPQVNVYSLIAPTSVSFYLPDEYKDYTASEKDNIDYSKELFEGNGVTHVDAYSALEAHKDEAIYARTDHHWLPLGAYYAAQEFAKTAGVPFNDISTMDTDTREDYVGSMYTYTQSTILSENPEEFTYYIPRNKYTTEYYDEYFNFDYEGELFMDITYYSPVNYYLVFMGGDDKIVHISTDVDNDRTLVIFKDSYGNAMVPCLVGSFSDIYVCDVRYFYLNAVDFCRQVGCTDLLFAMNSFSATGGNEDCIEDILYNY